jgi:hypothetical protein
VNRSKQPFKTIISGKQKVIEYLENNNSLCALCELGGKYIDNLTAKIASLPPEQIIKWNYCADENPGR